jgi:hypothetical protein
MLLLLQVFLMMLLLQEFLVCLLLLCLVLLHKQRVLVSLCWWLHLLLLL